MYKIDKTKLLTKPRTSLAKTCEIRSCRVLMIVSHFGHISTISAENGSIMPLFKKTVLFAKIFSADST